MKRTLALIAAIAIAMAGTAAPAVAGPKGGPKSDQAFSSFMDQLVAKGTVTAAQAQAIIEAFKAKKAERHAKMEAFSEKADAIIAKVLGMTTEAFRAARASRTLPLLTADQKSAIRAQLDALAASMGLPRPPKK